MDSSIYKTRKFLRFSLHVPLLYKFAILTIDSVVQDSSRFWKCNNVSYVPFRLFLGQESTGVWSRFWWARYPMAKEEGCCSLQQSYPVNLALWTMLYKHGGVCVSCQSIVTTESSRSNFARCFLAPSEPRPLLTSIFTFSPFHRSLSRAQWSVF